MCSSFKLIRIQCSVHLASDPKIDAYWYNLDVGELRQIGPLDGDPQTALDAIKVTCAPKK